uniref:ZP domain-containing protein n=1 Tax=Sinocyclocheilus grahami TaxID=75366 RepID=A0A672LI41_SINGR
YSESWYERSSNAYFLGDFINLEASVVRANHVPLRVFVESCAATLGPSGEALLTTILRCMMDAKLTESRSRFMSRIQDDKLQFQIEAFRFEQDSSGMIYITCHLKATTTSSPTDTMNKACSFVKVTNSWTAVNGDNQVCGCCEISCVMRKGRSLDTDGIVPHFTPSKCVWKFVNYCDRIALTNMMHLVYSVPKMYTPIQKFGVDMI